MSSHDHPRVPTEPSLSDTDVEKLLESAGPRDSSLSPEELAALVGPAELVWRRQQRQRRQSGLRRGLLGVAAAVLVAIGVWWLQPGTIEVPVSELALRAGLLEVETESGWRRVDIGSAPLAGSRLRTTTDSIGLEGPDGLWIRVAAGSEFAIDSQRMAELFSGQIDIDTGDVVERPAFTVATVHGEAHDLGTRFAVELGDELRVRVREGRVEFAGDEVHRVLAGQELTRLAGGPIDVRELPLDDAAWDWALEAAAPFELSGSTLAQYLEWLRSETGWQIRYEDASLEGEAADIVLRGSLRETDPRQTLETVLAIAGLTRERDGDEVVIRR